MSTQDQSDSVYNDTRISFFIRYISHDFQAQGVRPRVSEPGMCLQMGPEGERRVGARHQTPCFWGTEASLMLQPRAHTQTPNSLEFPF